MSSIKIKELPEKIDILEDEDLLVIEDAEDTKKISLIRMRSAFSMDSTLTAIKSSLSEKINSFLETHSSKYKELVEKNNNLEAICHNLSNDHIHDAERIFELEDRLVLQQDNVATLQTERNRLLTLITELQTQKGELSTQIEKLNSDLESSNSTMVELQSQFDDLRAKTNELQEVNKELQTIVDTLETESKDTIDGNFTDVNNKLAESVEDLMAYIRYYHPDVDEIFGEE